MHVLRGIRTTAIGLLHLRVDDHSPALHHSRRNRGRP
jgi:hypothetical protein